MTNLTAFMQTIANLLQEEQIEKINELKALPSCQVLHQFKKYYAVLNGKDGVEVIEAEWYGFLFVFILHLLRSRHRADIHPLIDTRHIFYKKFEDLASAIQYMILRGEDPRSYQRRAADFNNFTESFEALTTGVDAPAAPSPSTPQRTHDSPSITSVTSISTVPRAARSHRWSIRRANTRERSPPHDKNSLPAARAVNNNSNTRTHTRTTAVGVGEGPSGQRVSNHASTRSMRGTSDILPSSSVLLMTWIQAVHEDSGRVFLNWRDSRGRIIASIFSPPPHNPDNHVPSLGRAIDVWADANGISDSFLLDAYNSWVASADSNEFAASMSHVSSDQEARWLWSIMKVPNDHASHIRNFQRF